jgi:hypothetical protein
MGANAQTSVPVFTSGQVLTAQQQTEINTGIPVFADSTARDAAFGGTGEKTLAEGQFAFLEDTDTTQYYDGSTWQAVGGTSGLTFITGATFTTAATVSFASGVFTSTYQNYIVLLNLTASSTDQAFAWRVNNAGSPRTTADYIGATNQTTSGASLTSTGSNSTTSFSVGIARNTFQTTNMTSKKIRTMADKIETETQIEAAKTKAAARQAVKQNAKYDKVTKQPKAA